MERDSRVEGGGYLRMHFWNVERRHTLRKKGLVETSKFCGLKITFYVSHHAKRCQTRSIRVYIGHREISPQSQSPCTRGFQVPRRMRSDRDRTLYSFLSLENTRVNLSKPN